MSNPGRAYQLLHSDAASAELEALGLDSSIFGAAGVPCPIWQSLVPRRSNVFDSAPHTYGTGTSPVTFARTSDGLYIDAAGSYQVAGNGVSRPGHTAAGVFLGYLLEPASTNKCTNWNANPNAGLTSLNKTGDAASVMSRVSDAAILAASGLSAICSDGNVIELDNSAGSTAANILVSGTTTNTNVHTISVFARKVSGAGAATLQTNTGAFSVAITASNQYARVSATGSPSSTSNRLAVSAAAGVTVRFVLNQLEEKNWKTSPIVTAGAAATRSADEVTYDSVPPGFSVSEGMLTLVLSFPGGYMRPFLSRSLCGFRNSGNTGPMMWLDHATLQRFRFDSGSGVTDLTTPNLNDGERARLVSYWGGTTQGIMFNGPGGWVSASGAFGGSIQSDSIIKITRSIPAPVYLSNIQLFNRALAATEIQRVFTSR